MKPILIKSKARMETQIQNLCKRERELRGIQKQTESELSEVKNRLDDILSGLNVDSMQVDGFSVVRSEQSRESVKVSELREAFGSAVEKFVHLATFKVFRITEKTAAIQTEKKAA